VSQILTLVGLAIQRGHKMVHSEPAPMPLA